MLLLQWMLSHFAESSMRDNKLIFTYTKGGESPYIDSLQTFDQSKFNKKMECRFYFDNNTVIKKILSDSARCGGEPTVDLAKIYLVQCSRYKKLLTKK
jgi:hypothetical protein